MLELRPLPSLLYREKSSSFKNSASKVEETHIQEIDNIFVNSEQNEEQIDLEDLDRYASEQHDFTEMRQYNKMIEDIMNLDGK